MVLYFKSLELHNFGSYASAKFDLTNHGFCAVTGKNLCKKDNSTSNGSGKSTPWSAICYAITGETISGLTNNLKNINVDENECWVKLDLLADNNSFELTRIHKPKSDLKIIKNGVDISGKSIRESEKVLSEHLPDLTKDLIASTIIVGQGMPNKFSSFSPSGRKELLEKLTKSDFMIEDLKERLINRQTKLQQQLQEYVSSNLVNKTNLDNAEATLLATDRELSEPMVDFDSEISTYQNAVEKAKINYQAAQASLASFESNFDKLNNDLLAITTSKASESTELQAEYSNQKNKLDLDQYKYNVDIKQLQAEVAKLKQITDICPTCGQKLPNISKPDTSLQEQQIQVLTEKVNLLLAESTKITDKYKNDLKELDNKFEEALNKKQEEVKNIKLKINEVKQMLSNLNYEIVTNTTKLNQALFNKENCTKRRSFLQAQKQELELKINTLKNAISITTNAKLDLDEHIAVVKKMDTLVKRDFRGYLLTDIINYIDAKAKEYCKIVFNTDELNIYLDGNALDISYAGKMFDSLSGGEKQRCDLILQFAIRDLLQTYLGYSSNILVLDEIFDNLDKQATTKIIDLITEKLKDIESIFIISHHADELTIPIDSELLIVKNEFGISEVSAA